MAGGKGLSNRHFVCSQAVRCGVYMRPGPGGRMADGGRMVDSCGPVQHYHDLGSFSSLPPKLE